MVEVFLKFFVFISIFHQAFSYVEENKEQGVIISEVDEIFDEFALLKNEHHNRDILENAIHKIIFIWPIDLKLIKQVVLNKPNFIVIIPKSPTFVISPHTGIVIAVDEKTKSVTTKHIVEGGICYNIILKNVEKCKVKVGEIIKKGQKIGEVTKSLTLEIWQVDISISPIAYALFPPVDGKIIKIVRKI